MRVNSIKKNNKKYKLSVTFCNESEERVVLQDIIFYFENSLSINCMITDLDTSYFVFESYFPRQNYYVFDRITSSTIFAFRLNHDEVFDVISNWGYYTLDAKFSLGSIELPNLDKKHVDYLYKFESMPIVITQVLDSSLHIVFDERYFDEIVDFFTRYHINIV